MSDLLIRAWMPITKKADGTFEGILSDNSLDRDGEFMTKDLLQSWAKTKALPMLLNHENKMEKLVGVWKGLHVVQKGNKTALVAQPHFFSEEANPLAAQAKKQVEEALALGLNPGISIGAIPAENDATVEKEINGVMRRGFDKAELVEATLVPVQSNRNASFASIAKEFDLVPSETKEIVKEVSGEESPMNNLKEEKTMDKTYSQEEVDALVAQKLEEAKVAKAGEGDAPKPGEDNKEEEDKKKKKEKDEEKSLSSEVSALKKMIEDLSKNRFADLTKAPTVKEVKEKEEVEVPKSLDMNVMIKHYYK